MYYLTKYFQTISVYSRLFASFVFLVVTAAQTFCPVDAKQDGKCLREHGQR